MATKNVQDQLEKLRKQQEVLKAREKQLKAKISSDTRKADAHAKIQIGGALISVLKKRGYDVTATDIDVNKFIAFLDGQEERGRYLGSALGLEKDSEER